MSNVTAIREDSHQDGKMLLLPMAAQKLYKGSLVAFNASGYVDHAADTASFNRCGIAYETVDNSGGAAGALSIRVLRDGVYALDFTGTASQATVGQQVTMSDDHTVAVAATTTNDIVCGRCVEFISATKVLVDIAAA
jgi:hypothetical protein